ncbi:hypothetical protein NK55_00465 [Thermosynechococcus sp. NK55a]|nr:hypothetical protein NK55_00465 [Thermosynechococcus sp. NK55a]
MVEFVQMYAGTPPLPPPYLEQCIVEAGLHQYQLNKRRWQVVSILGVGAIATTTASVWFLKPAAQVAQQTPADGLETFIATNWQALFESAEPVTFE